MVAVAGSLKGPRRADTLPRYRHSRNLAYSFPSVVKPGPKSRYRMRNLPRLIVFLLFVAVVGGAVFLATWDIPPPVSSIEKVIPDERFQR